MHTQLFYARFRNRLYHQLHRPSTQEEGAMTNPLEQIKE